MSPVTEMKGNDICGVCSGTLRALDVPNYNLFQCDTCHELNQRLPSGTMSPIGQFLQRNALGDDRARAAISSPNVNSVKSFLDIFEQADRMFSMTLAEARGGLRTILAQTENRIDFAIGKLTGLDLAFEEAGEVLSALREARNFVSVLPSRSRGLAKEE